MGKTTTTTFNNILKKGTNGSGSLPVSSPSPATIDNILKFNKALSLIVTKQVGCFCLILN